MEEHRKEAEQTINSFQQEIEKQWTLLSKSVDETRIEIETTIEYLHQSIDNIRKEIEQEIMKEHERIRKKFEKEILLQRQGLEQKLYTIRNFIGFVIGTVSTYLGGIVNDRLLFIQRTSFGIQSGQIAHGLFVAPRQHQHRHQNVHQSTGTTASEATTSSNSRNHDNSTNAVSKPSFGFIPHTVPLAAACTVVSHHARGGEGTQFLYKRILPPVTVATALGGTVHQVLDKLDSHDEILSPRMTRHLIVFISIGGTVIVSTLLPMPLQLIIAASVAGAKLMVDSTVDEVVGNWVSFIEKIGPQRLNLYRRLYNFFSRRFQRNVVYPIFEVLEELEVTYLTTSPTTITTPTATTTTQTAGENENNNDSSNNNNSDSILPNGNIFVTNNDDNHHHHPKRKIVRRRRHLMDAVKRNIRLRISGYVAISGIIIQQLIQNSTRIRSFFQRKIKY